MHPVKSIRSVALIKSTNGVEKQDRYSILLKENNFIPLSIPTLEFKFQLNELKTCLSQPERYSGPQKKLKSLYHKHKFNPFYIKYRINFD